MGEELTIAEIEAQYPSEWILVEDPITNDALEVQSGKVRWHSADRDEIYRHAGELKLCRSAVMYTGRMPENIIINI